MGLDAGALAVELVVLGSNELLGLLGAVGTARSADRCADSHARRLAGEDTLGEHFEWRFQQLGRWGAGGRGGVVRMSTVEVLMEGA